MKTNLWLPIFLVVQSIKVIPLTTINIQQVQSSENNSSCNDSESVIAQELTGMSDENALVILSTEPVVRFETKYQHECGLGDDTTETILPENGGFYQVEMS